MIIQSVAGPVSVRLSVGIGPQAETAVSLMLVPSTGDSDAKFYANGDVEAGGTEDTDLEAFRAAMQAAIGAFVTAKGL